MTIDQFKKMQNLSDTRRRLCSILEDCTSIARSGYIGTLTFHSMFSVRDLDVPSNMKAAALIKALMEQVQTKIDEIDKQIEEL